MFGSTNASWLFSVTDSSWENTLKHDQLSWCVWWKTDIDVIASTCFNRSIQDYQGAIRAVSRSLFRLDIATKYWNLQLQINDSIRLGREVSEVRWDLRPIYHCLNSNYVLNIVRNEKLLPDGVKLIHLTVVRNCPLVPPWLVSCYPALVGYLSENLLCWEAGALLSPCFLPARWMWCISVACGYRRSVQHMGLKHGSSWKAVDIRWFEVSLALTWLRNLLFYPPGPGKWIYWSVERVIWGWSLWLWCVRAKGLEALPHSAQLSCSFPLLPLLFQGVPPCLSLLSSGRGWDMF